MRRCAHHQTLSLAPCASAGRPAMHLADDYLLVCMRFVVYRRLSQLQLSAAKTSSLFDSCHSVWTLLLLSLNGPIASSTPACSCPKSLRLHSLLSMACSEHGARKPCGKSKSLINLTTVAVEHVYLKGQGKD